MTYREIAEAANLATVEAAAARVRRAGWTKRVKNGTDAIEVLVPPGGIVRRARRYRKVEEADLRDMLALRAAGKSIDDIAAIKDRSTAVVSYCLKSHPMVKAAAVPARPVKMPGESKSAYGGRVLKWKLETDPDFRKQSSAAIRAGIAKRKAKLLRAERRAEREAARAVVAPVMPAPATDIAPAIVAAPPPTLWQRIVGWFR